MAAEGGGIMKVEAGVGGGGDGVEEAGIRRVRNDQLYVGGLKKARRERLGCTTAKERISKMPPCVAGKRSSIYRGVTRHRWTGRYEAHLWDKSTWNQNQNKKGKQVYLGAYDDEEAAARAYDLAALKYWGAGTLINFPVTDYSRDLEEMQMVSKEEYLVSLRRKSSAFSRGFPKCRGVSRHPQSSRLEASLGQVLGSDYCNSLNCSSGADSLVEKKYASGISMDRKIDLTSYIRWWGPKRAHHSDSFSKCLDDKLSDSEDIIRELRAFECPKQPTEPYQLPSLGLPCDINGRASSVSACGILSRSAPFKNLQQRSSESRDSIYNKEMGYEKSIPILSTVGGIERAGVSLGFSDLPLQRTPYPRAPPLPASSKTSWNPVDPVPDPIFWTSLVPSTGLTVNTALRKTEASSPYPYNCQE